MKKYLAFDYGASSGRSILGLFDGEKLSELIAPLELGWKDRTRKETAIMTDLVPLLKRMTGGQKISGLSAYDEE